MRRLFQKQLGIDGFIVLSDLEMEMGAGSPSGLSDPGDDLFLLDPLPFFHEIDLVVSIDRYKFLRVAKDDEVSISPDRIARIDHFPRTRGFDRGPCG